MNPFPYSSDNKRYQTFSYATKKHYGTKVFKVGLNAGFTCPNRDGRVGYGGCSFCNALGSGDFQGNTQADLMSQFESGCAIQRRKWPHAKAIAYFQAFTNTYAPLEKLKELYEPFIKHPDVIALAIATRIDCLDEEIISYLESLTKIKDIYLELGLQSIHDASAQRMNRGYTWEQFKAGYARLLNSPLKVIVHLLNGYPGESEAMMIQSAKEVGKLRPYGVKIHMLNVLRHSSLGQEYLKEPFDIMDKDQYIQCVIRQLEVLPQETVILRLTGDGDPEDLLAPLWVKDKIRVLNDIDKRMAQENTTQGNRYEV